MLIPNRSLLFLIGLILGIAVGSGFFYFKIDELIKKEGDCKLPNPTLAIEKKIASSFKKETETYRHTQHEDTLQNTMNSAETFSKKYSNETALSKVIAEADSLIKDNSAAKGFDDLIVRKDQMIDVIDFAVTNLGETKETSKTDSLLEKISEIKKKDIVASFKVEFWVSPINYKGYKMAKNKIILYGLNPEELITFFHNNDDDGIFLKQNQNYFRIHYTDNYKQFERVTDTSIIEKLK
jgi:hypothetical protein